MLASISTLTRSIPSCDLRNKGLTLVVTPLVSLMEDQLAALSRLGIKAAKLNATSTREEVNEVHNVGLSLIQCSN